MTKKTIGYIPGADPCPFCGCDFLFFKDGAVACDECQAEGPFSGEVDPDSGHPVDKREAVKLWNERML